MIDAAKQADENRLRAQDSADAMVGALRKVEQELAALLEEVRREADALEQSRSAAQDPEPAEAEAADEPTETDAPPGSDEAAAPEAGLDSQAHKSVADKSDLELAELHQIAQGRVDEGPDEEREYWRALLEATVDEAVERKDFGASVAADDPGWFERRRRTKVLGPLASARERAMQPKPQEGAAP